MKKAVLYLDIEVYKNWFLVAMLSHDTDKIYHFEIYPGTNLDKVNVLKLISQHRVVGFNSTNYDLPLLALALVEGTTTQQIKKASDQIIVEGYKYWDLGLRPLPCEHVDLMSIAPGTASLKLYGGRIHAPRLQDLPFDPSASVTPEMRIELTRYCDNDLKLTQRLYEKLLPAIELREQLSAKTGINLLSAADQKIAEKLIEQDLAGKANHYANRNTSSRVPVPTPSFS